MPRNAMDGNGNLEAIALLQKWFIDRCDGNWEHSWGVTIETIEIFLKWFESARI